MNNTIEYSLENSQFWHLIACIPIITLLLRAFLTYLRTWEEELKDVDDRKRRQYAEFYNGNRWKKFLIIYRGANKNDPSPDMWYNTMIGTIELIAFPYIIRADQFIIIGAWLSYKVIASWKVWSTNRLKFNGFLLANALVIILSFILMHLWIP